MREFETTFDKGLKKGLREDDENPRNKEALVECLNTKPSEEGLIPIVPVTTPMDVTMAWPFPQVFDRPLNDPVCDGVTNVGYSGNDPLSFEASSSTVVTITNGLPPFTWAITGTGLSWATATTYERTNTLVASVSATGTGSWTATDKCAKGTGSDTLVLFPGSATWGDNSADDYTSKTADRLMYEFQPDTNQTEAHAGYLGMGKGNGADRTNRSVIQFDIKSDLEALGATTIVSATLYCYLNLSVVGDHNVSAYRLLQNFVGGEVTWNSFSTGNAWNTAGCAAASDAGEDGGSYDRLATAEDTIALADGLAPGSYAFILDLTDLAQEWLDGTASEYGILLKSDNEEILNYLTVENREGPDTQRPYLEIEYT